MACIEEILNLVQTNFADIFYVLGAAIWLLHLFRQTGRVTVVIIALAGLCVVLFFAIVGRHEAVSTFELTSIMWLYGVCIYALLCDVLLWKLAAFLTQKRGPWPAPGSEDTELGVLMEPEVGHGEAEVYTGVQA